MSVSMLNVVALTVPIVLLASLWYVPARLRHLLGLRRRWPIHTAVVAAVLAYPLAMPIVHRAPPPIAMALGTATGAVVGVHLYLALLLLVLDVLRLAVRVPAKASAWGAVALASAIVAAGAWHAEGLRVNRIEIPLDGLQRDVTIVHVSDAHIGPLRGRGRVERIVREVNRQQPDLVLLNGDLVDGASALEGGVLAPLADLRAPAFFTTGNHESYVGTARALQAIAGRGVRILRNERVDVAGIQLIGLDYMNADRRTFDLHAVNRLTIEEEIRKIPIAPERPAILMHHSPVGMRYAGQAGIDLMLSGHTHAGQVFPATHLVRLFFPLSEGLHAYGGMRVFVSQGAGTFGPRLRLGTSNEIDVIRLVPRR